MQDQKEMRDAVSALHDSVKHKLANDVEQKQKIDKINADLDKHEEDNQKLVKELEQEKSERKLLEEKQEHLEKLLTRSQNSAKDETPQEVKAYNKFIMSGEKTLTADEKKYLRTDSDPDGGYLVVPTQIQKEIIKPIVEISPFRSICKIIIANALRAESYTRDTTVTGYWTGEGESTTESQEKYGKLTVNLESLTAEVHITTRKLRFSQFNMESEINADVREQFNLLEAQAFVNGDDVKKPEGFMFNTDVPYLASGTSDSIGFDNMIEITGRLKIGYDAIYGFTRRTLAFLRQQQSDSGEYLWQPGNLGAGIPNAVNGVRYMLMPQLDEIGADNFPVIFGDFRQGYEIYDSPIMEILRDDYTLASTGKVRFLFRKYVGGAVRQAEALIKLKCEAI